MGRVSIDSFTTIDFWIRKLSLAALMVGCLQTAAWSQVKTTEIVGNPSISGDRVTLRIKVKDENEKPVMGLIDTDFQLRVDGNLIDFRSNDWKSPEETVFPPAWIIVLLDFTGSMQQTDSRGTTRIEGAIKAIREFTDLLAERGPNTHLAIVPFGEGGNGCAGYSITNEVLNNFFPAGDFKLRNYLDYLAQETPCASTNIYDPLSRAVRFLANEEDERFALPERPNQPEPRLAIILLSDGYHNKPNEEEDFRSLTTLLRRNDRLVVHTLGYGLTPEQLGRKYNLGRAAKRSDINAGTIPEDEFVDKERLQEIARLTGGISEFSPEALTVAEQLKVFLNALLGEYQITYTEPNAERGSQHEVQAIVREVESQAKLYRIQVFGRSVPLGTRMIMMLLIVIVLLGGGILPFWLWAQHLKQEALEG